MARIYYYTLHERIWHWLQAVAILLLMWTGVEIHHPQTWSLLGFQTATMLHNLLGFALIANALLGLLYHIFTEEILQFIPHPQGFFDMAWKQAAYYLRGIFRGEPHPIEKDPDNKLNPLQKVTYLLVLNLLLPAQLISGLLIWGAQRWPLLTERLGGLAWLGTVHTLIAWSFAAFLLMHIYLATTGHTPMANIKAMLVGWEELHANEKRPAGQPAPARRYGLPQVGRIEAPHTTSTSQGDE